MADEGKVCHLADFNSADSKNAPVTSPSSTSALKEAMTCRVTTLPFVETVGALVCLFLTRG